MELIDAIREIIEGQESGPIDEVALAMATQYWTARDVSVETLEQGTNVPDDNLIYQVYDVFVFLNGQSA